MGVYDQFTKLTPAEQAYIAANPDHALTIRNSKDTAFNETKRRFGKNGHNDKSDAFRHCFWSAILARDLGYKNALHFTTAHESDPANPPGEKTMDLHNNGVGLAIGKLYTDLAPVSLPLPLRLMTAITPRAAVGDSVTSIERLLTTDSALSDKCYQALLDGKLKVLVP